MPACAWRWPICRRVRRPWASSSISPARNGCRSASIPSIATSRTGTIAPRPCAPRSSGSARVNNAGAGMQHIGNVLVGAPKKFYEVDADTWRNAIDVNFNGPFMMAKAIAPTLVAQGWGRIVNIETSNYTMMMEGFSPYGPSKAALEAATVIWAKDLAGTGVTVNALAPGGPANTRMIPATEVTDR